jgi:hypothetical protein
MLTEAFKKEMDKFDQDRVIPAWDGLVSRQQMELANSRVPTMFISNQAEDRQVRGPLPSTHTVSRVYYSDSSKLLTSWKIYLIPKGLDEVIP